MANRLLPAPQFDLKEPSALSVHHLLSLLADVEKWLQGQGGSVAYAGHLGGAAVGALSFLALRRGRMRW